MILLNSYEILETGSIPNDLQTAAPVTALPCCRTSGLMAGTATPTLCSGGSGGSGSGSNF